MDMLYAVLGEKRDLIVRCFVSQVRMFRVGAAEMTARDVAHHIDEYLSALAVALRQGHRHAPAAVRKAVEHAEQRAMLGYDVRSLLAEMGILRATIVEVAMQSGGISEREWYQLSELMEECSVEAAARFLAPHDVAPHHAPPPAAYVTH